MENIKLQIKDVFTEIADGLETGSFGKRTAVGITTLGSEISADNLRQGAFQFAKDHPGVDVVMIGPICPLPLPNLFCENATTEEEQHKVMERLLDEGRIQACVTQHYNFPNGGEAVVDEHRSQVVVAAFRWGPPGDDGEPTEPDYLDPRLETLRGELAVANVCAALTALPGAIAVSVGGAATTLPAGPYRDLVTGNPMPAPALVGVRAGMQSESTSCAYTTGLGRFGRMDLERLDVAAPPAAVYGQMCDIVAFALASGTIFLPGQALEVGGPEPLVATAAVSPFTGQEALRLGPGAPTE